MEGRSMIPEAEREASDFALQVITVVTRPMGPGKWSHYETLKELIQERDAALAADAAATATSAFIPKKNGPPIQQAMEQTLSAVIEGVNARRQYVEHRSACYIPADLTRDAEALLALTECATL